jgi:hypothetical protein
MTSDDQFFFDYVSILTSDLLYSALIHVFVQLASIPHDVRRYSLEVADSIDRQVDHAAKAIKDTLAQQSWLPPTVRPARVNPRESSKGLVNRVQKWMAKNRAWTAAILAFVGTGVVLYYGSKKLHGKRRKARRASNGGRKEIVGMCHSTWSGCARI